MCVVPSSSPALNLCGTNASLLRNSTVTSSPSAASSRFSSRCAPRASLSCVPSPSSFPLLLEQALTAPSRPLALADPSLDPPRRLGPVPPRLSADVLVVPVDARPAHLAAAVAPPAAPRDGDPRRGARAREQGVRRAVGRRHGPGGGLPGKGDAAQEEEGGGRDALGRAVDGLGLVSVQPSLCCRALLQSVCKRRAESKGETLRARRCSRTRPRREPRLAHPPRRLATEPAEAALRRLVHLQDTPCTRPRPAHSLTHLPPLFIASLSSRPPPTSTR